MLKNIPVVVAATVMGKGQQFIRIGLQRGLLPIGEAMQIDPEKRRCRYNYYISPRLLRHYTGCTSDDIIQEMRRCGYGIDDTNKRWGW